MRPVLRAVTALMLPGIERAEIREDRLRPLEADTVLGLERRDLGYHRSFVLARLDLSRDEVDPELREPLAHRRGVRAPLGLKQRQHPWRSSRSRENNTAS